MNNSSYTKGSAWIWVIVAIVVLATIWAVTMHQASTPNTSSNNTATTTASNAVTILVPADINAYRMAILRHVQDGAADPVPTTQFVATTTVPNTVSADMLRNVAEAAAEYIPTQAGTSSLVIYFKNLNGTAYVLLNMDVDGWAGVSVAQGAVHPIVEKSLLAQAGITKVVFGPAPGDTINSIVQSYNASQNK